MQQITTAERNRRDEAHAAAAMAWSKDGKRSRTSGLGDGLRSTGGTVTPPEVRKRRQALHKTRLRASWDKAAAEQSPEDMARRLKALDRSRYFPHEGDRQRERAARRIEQA
jgi:hypothetical protein